MKHTQLSHSDYSVYPGQYVPLFDEEEVKEELKHIHEKDPILPPVNVNELADAYTVEVAIPGVKREELFIQADKNILSISVMQPELNAHTHGRFHLHEFNYQCFARYITLPEDVDASFARAEYWAGLLRMHIPKTMQPAKDIHTKVVVY